MIDFGLLRTRRTLHKLDQWITEYAIKGMSHSHSNPLGRQWLYSADVLFLPTR